MPYIKEESKPGLDIIINQFWALDEPELDYVITRLAIKSLKNMPTKFVSLNKIWGVLTGAAEEFYRRLIGPYENKKAQENGDVYSGILVLFNLKEEILDRQENT